jgi:N-acetylmuramoyl-L-alanine amidase
VTLLAADYPGARLRPSPNFGPRIGCAEPDMVILHYTGMETGEGAEDWLCSTESQVSSHYLVHEDGQVVQMVAETDRAWHAGKSFWAGETDINSRSIGIEIVNCGHFLGYRAFPDVQIDAVMELCRDILARYPIPASRFLAHSDVAPGRKIDPGEKFPWQRLHEAGIGYWVDPEPLCDGEASWQPDVGETQRLLALYGYEIALTGLVDEQTRIVVEAFQRHFRPGRVDGVIDRSTKATLRRLLASAPNTFPG